MHRLTQAWQNKMLTCWSSLKRHPGCCRRAPRRCAMQGCTSSRSCCSCVPRPRATTPRPLPCCCSLKTLRPWHKILVSRQADILHLVLAPDHHLLGTACCNCICCLSGAWPQPQPSSNRAGLLHSLHSICSLLNSQIWRGAQLPCGHMDASRSRGLCRLEPALR